MVIMAKKSYDLKMDPSLSLYRELIDVALGHCSLGLLVGIDRGHG
jgi:hypothetical protein